MHNSIDKQTAFTVDYTLNQVQSRLHFLNRYKSSPVVVLKRHRCLATVVKAGQRWENSGQRFVEASRGFPAWGMFSRHDGTVKGGITGIPQTLWHAVHEVKYAAYIGLYVYETILHCSGKKQYLLIWEWAVAAVRLSITEYIYHRWRQVGPTS